MGITWTAACMINFNIVCNGLTLGVPYGYADEATRRPVASDEQKVLAAHINGRIWAAKGATLTVTPAPKLMCSHVNMHYDCYNASVDTSYENYPIDEFEFALINKIWGPLFGAAPPVTTTTLPTTVGPSPSTGVPR